MSVEQIEQYVLKLSDEERRQFAQWFYEHENELAGPEVNNIDPEIKAEILLRRHEVDVRPELLEPWAGTTERARAKLHELRRQKAQAR